MAEATLDQFLDALECVVAVPLDAFEEEPRSGTDRLVLGRCSADGFAMYRDSESGFTCRPASVGPGVPCPADPRTYTGMDGKEYPMGHCPSETFVPWKPGKR